MAYASQTLEECFFLPPDLEPYKTCCDNVCCYPNIPVAQGKECDMYSTVVYTIYPAVEMNDQDLCPVVQPVSQFYPTVEMKEQELCPLVQLVSQPIVAENVCNEGDKSGMFLTSSPLEAKGKCDLKNQLNLDESLTLSDFNPPEESEEKSTLLSSGISNYSFDNSGENAKFSGDSGFYGSNGCWYPRKNSSPDSQVSLSVDSSSSSSDLSTRDGAKSPGIVPPSKLMMPKQLMSFYNYYQRLDLPSAALGRPHLVHTFPQEGNICVEDLWLAHMKLLFRNFPNSWKLQNLHTYKSVDKSWSSFKDMAKVRFYCRNCLDGWTSMFGVVVFFYSWNSEISSGTIRYQVSGQKCGKCNPNTFEMPLWYPEEAQKVITNLYYEIASRVYGLRTPQQIRTRRLGQPVNQHNKSLCQGCTNGLCKPDDKVTPDGFSGSSGPVNSPVSASHFSQDLVPCTSYSIPPLPVASAFPPDLHPPQPYITTTPYFDPSLYQYPVDADVPYPNYVPHVQNYVPQMAVYYPYNY